MFYKNNRGKMCMLLVQITRSGHVTLFPRHHSYKLKTTCYFSIAFFWLTSCKLSQGNKLNPCYLTQILEFWNIDPPKTPFSLTNNYWVSTTSVYINTIYTIIIMYNLVVSWVEWSNIKKVVSGFYK